MSLNTSPPAPRTVDSPASPVAIWTPVRMELKAWFQRNAPSLGELYEGSVYLMFETPLSGRVRFIAHAVREIRNRLPDVISGTRGGGTIQYKNRLDDIVKIWQKFGFSLDGNLLPPQVNAEADISTTPDVTIPRDLLIKIATLIKDHESARSKPIDTAVRLFEALAPENQSLRDSLRPIVLQWLDTTDWFMKKAHDSGAVDASCDVEELKSKFELFELTLSTLVRGFFTTLEELDEILDAANS